MNQMHAIQTRLGMSRVASILTDMAAPLRWARQEMEARRARRRRQEALRQDLRRLLELGDHLVADIGLDPRKVRADMEERA